ncbi:MAG: type IV secretion system DNA-binding domain-containing protein [Thermoguttaceae bacterium]|nr:type IV secretion system DNA-binding domain-containing protein [Thermoguttaceae bacterium]MDW8038985.1 type IV secretion system DNA-binding domain-containing protein [Thermoguttaceae bacterium]
MQRDWYIYSYPTPADQGPDGWNAVGMIRLLWCSEHRDSRAAAKEVFRQQLHQQADFLHALYCPEEGSTFAVRYVAEPEPFSFSAGKIHIALLVKTKGREKAEAEKKAKGLCEQMFSLLEGFFPDHGWKAVSEKEAFEKLWQPFNWQEAELTEIRRREELLLLDKAGRRPSLNDQEGEGNGRSGQTVYFVHPFLARPGSLARLFRTLLLAPAPVVYQATICPAVLNQQEKEAIENQILRCELLVQKREAMARLGPIFNQTISEGRARALRSGWLKHLEQLQSAPFFLTISLASPQPMSKMLLEAMAGELFCTCAEEDLEKQWEIGGFSGGGWQIVYPTNEEEKEKAEINIQQLGHTLWGTSLAPEPLRRLRCLVNATEAAGAFRFPIAFGEELAGMEVRAVRFRGLPPEIARLAQSQRGSTSLCIGENPYLGKTAPIMLSEPDRLLHLYVLGQTGTGKTTLLKSMILADMHHGKGLAVIDPHGDLFEELLRYIPKGRLKDVVILDPTDVERPVGLNLLECPREDQRYFIARELRMIVERLLRDQFDHASVDYAGPMFYQHLQMNLLLAMSNPEDPGTLLELYEIFQHKNYWKRWLPLRWKDPLLERWVTESLPSMDYTQRDREGVSWGEYLSSKFMDFVFDPKLRGIFGQKHSTIQLRRILDEGKILLVNLAKGQLAEANSRFLGMVLMAKIFAAALERVELPPHQRRTFYLYVDEFQSLATQSLILLLSEARKFGVALILANQFLSQIKDQCIIQSIFGNIGNLICFRLGQEDAKLIEPYFAPYFDLQDLTSLPNWHACARWTVKGQMVPAFTLRTVLPPPPSCPQIAACARDWSRHQYGVPARKVDLPHHQLSTQKKPAS